MATKSLLENACLDSGLFAFSGRVGNLADAGSIRKDEYCRIYSAKEAPIRNDEEPPFDRALFIGTHRNATRFACAKAADACRARVQTYTDRGEHHNAAVSAHFADRYAERAR